MVSASAGAAAPGAVSRIAEVNGTALHYVTAGQAGSPVLLVHGFPETWWVFNKVLPLLAAQHRVVAVDLRGFGDSALATAEFGSAVAAADLAALVEHLDLGPVHLTGQDISGSLTTRLALTRPDLVKTYTVIETALPGFGFERLADVTHGGAWHIGVLAAPGVAEALLVGREQWFIGEYFLPALTRRGDAFSAADIGELVRAYSRPGAWLGPMGLYRSALEEVEEMRETAAHALSMPVLAVDGGSGPFTSGAFATVADDLTVASIEGVGHHVAMEAPAELASLLLEFHARFDT